MAPVRLVISISRKEGTTSDQFYKYWKEVHGPLFIEKVPLARQYISKYEQYHVRSSESATVAKEMATSGSVAVDGCDGITVLSADSLEDLQKVMTSKEFLEIVNPDNKVYAGEVRSVLLAGNERVVMFERDNTN